jgi:hypothetical protein
LFQCLIHVVLTACNVCLPTDHKCFVPMFDCADNDHPTSSGRATIYNQASSSSARNSSFAHVRQCHSYVLSTITTTATTIFRLRPKHETVMTAVTKKGDKDRKKVNYLATHRHVSPHRCQPTRRHRLTKCKMAMSSWLGGNQDMGSRRKCVQRARGAG